MVCDRCKLVIRNILEEKGIQPVYVELGEVDLGNIELDDQQIKTIKEKLELLGFELLDDRTRRIIDKIKTLIIDSVQNYKEPSKIKFSDYISKNVNYDYNYLSKLFSESEGITIENYHINQKIEKVKELLIYDELTLSEIAYKLGYSSVAHLSNQFKKVTGQNPTEFKKIKDVKKRLPLDKV